VARRVLVIAGCIWMVSCSAQSPADEIGPAPQPGADASLSPDVSLDTGSPQDVLFEFEPDAATNMCPGLVQSFIWIANTGEGTLSKVCTSTGIEVARYYTSPAEAGGDPSRTSVNLHGDMVVTNRDPTSGPSSVTKFAAAMKDCVDRNSNGAIETSVGPDDVKPWGQDECMVWNTPLSNGMAIGARATAWDGEEDRETGAGGHVYIGAMVNKTVYRLDGETGAILAQKATGIAHYGGAMDGKGNFWTVSMGCTIGMCQIERTSLNDLSSHEAFPVHCGYGITVDGKGRVWTAGLGCVSRFDPVSKKNDWLTTGAQDFNRGLAVGLFKSAGSIWAASTNGELLQVEPETLQLVKRQKVGSTDMVGVAIDHEGYVWTVSQSGNAAYKVDPGTWEVITVPIGSKPYTYSDMTGMQLLNVAPPPK